MKRVMEKSGSLSDVAARWTALYVATDLLKAGTVETAVGSPAES